MWLLHDKEISKLEDFPEGSYGFIYSIVNKTKEAKGETPYLYIGKKNLYSEITKKLGKREIEALPDKRLSKKRKVKKESDWLHYCGSSLELKADISAGDIIEKRILDVCFCKTELTYREIKSLFYYNVLETDLYYNKSINDSWFKGNLFCNKK